MGDTIRELGSECTLADDMCDRNHGAASGRGPQLRPLCLANEKAVRKLCADCFPIHYPDHWYNYILSSKVYSMAAFTTTGELMGMIVGELQPLVSLEGEIGPVVDSASPDTTAMYIVSLGIDSCYRRQGLASHLVNLLLRHVARQPSCKVVYLHVLATNSPAINLYHRLGFKEHLTVPGYYTIHNTPADGLLYCSHVNGGQPYLGNLSSFCRRYICENVLCVAVCYICSRLYLLLKSLLFQRRFNF